MNIFYKILIMTFLGGAGAGISLLVLGREIACQMMFNMNVYIIIAAAYAGGALIAGIFRKRLNKSSVPVLNMVMSFSAIAGVFAAMGFLLFIRYFKVVLALQPEQAIPPMAAVVLPVIIFLPLAAFYFIGLAAGEALAANQKAKTQDLIRLTTCAAAAVGALIYFLLLRRYYTNIDVLYALGIFVLAGTYVLFRDKTLEGRWTMLAVITAVVIYLAFNVGGFKEKTDRASSRADYKSYTVIAEKEYPTVKFVMAKKSDVEYIFENGFLTYVIPDKKYAEMAALVQGQNTIVINGGFAGLIEELGKNKAMKKIVSYEYDQYTAFILEKLFVINISTLQKTEFKTGDITQDRIFLKQGFPADTVFINARQAGPESYSRKSLENLMKYCMVTGGKIVISVPESEKERVAETVKAVFGNAGDEKGFVTAIKDKNEK